MVTAASDYPLLDAFWTMLIIFGWVMWFWLLIVVCGDLFRRNDASGWAKAGWLTFMLFLPLVGVLIYLIVHGKGMAARQTRDAVESKAQFDEYIRSVSADGHGPTEQIAKGKQLLDSGAITPDEYETLKRKALAA